MAAKSIVCSAILVSRGPGSLAMRLNRGRLRQAYPPEEMMTESVPAVTIVVKTDMPPLTGLLRYTA